MLRNSFQVVMRLPGRTTVTRQSVQSYEEGVQLAERFLADRVPGEAPGARRSGADSAASLERV